MSESAETRIGLLPKDWRIQPLSETTIKIQDGTHFSPKSEDGPYRYVTSKNIQFGRLDLSNCGWISQQEHDAIYARCDVKYGDVLLTKDGANTGNASLNDQHEPFSLLSSVAILRTDGAAHHAGFILQYLLSPLGQRRLKDLMSGNAITRLTLQKIKAFETPVPSAPEQRRIAEILSTLDEAIEQTEALIAKYQQIKAGLMHDLFTRGVTPDGKLRPTRAKAPHLYKQSPLGWIPKEWEVQSLASLSQLITSGSRGWAEYYSDTGPLFMRISNLTREHINFRWDEVTRVNLPKSTEGQRTAIRPSDILISITADLGIVAVAHDDIGEAYVNQHIALVRPNVEPTLSRFIGHSLATVRLQKQFLRLNDSGAKAGLNLPAVGKILVPMPRDDGEAIGIAAMLDEADQSVECYKRELAKLRQQKHGLMHDLLTGRVRVKVDA